MLLLHPTNVNSQKRLTHVFTRRADLGSLVRLMDVFERKQT